MNYNFKKITKEEIPKYLLAGETLVCYLDGIAYLATSFSVFPKDIQEQMIKEGQWQLVIKRGKE